MAFDPSILLPTTPERQPYWRYEGSLTTPEFDEAVSWVIMPTITMKKSYFVELGLLWHIEKPARPPQPLFRRFVLVNTPAGATPPGTGEVEATVKGTPKKGGKKRG